MPIEVLRFGVGHRRREGPPGTKGIQGRVLHSDAHGVITELAFARGGLIEPHANPNSAYFIVIEGGGWVVVGEERLRVAAGEAVVWPPNVVHGAWTDHTPMRAFVVEFATGDEAPGVLPGISRPLLGAPGEDRPERADGALRPPARDPAEHDRSSGEPL